jgi:23S rRNA (guanosine2251-2'-O)-methyltransferase
MDGAMTRQKRPGRFRGTPEPSFYPPVSPREAVAGSGKRATRDKARSSGGSPASTVSRFYGRHAVTAALSNPDRTLRRLYGTKEALRLLETDFDADFGGLDIRPMETSQLDGLVRVAPHQGLVLDCDPLPDVHIEEVLLNLEEKAAILVLDQVTDPHNVGAILRSAAAFGAAFIVTQDRHSPPETGALAKAASGALEVVPWVRSVNLARALDVIAEAGFWRIGLDGAAPLMLADATSGHSTCLVLGAEGTGIRQNVAAHCDALARLPISNRVESLNVSNAAAVALYAVNQK